MKTHANPQENPNRERGAKCINPQVIPNTPLFKHFWQHIQRGITSGLAEWYKDELAKSAFEKEELC